MNFICGKIILIIPFAKDGLKETKFTKFCEVLGQKRQTCARGKRSQRKPKGLGKCSILNR